MNENIDLTKILKDCPYNWQFYSSAFGKVNFGCFSPDSMLIITKRNPNRMFQFTREGKYSDYPDGECCIFPSQEQRDWSIFSAPWYKREKFDPKTLKPFDKVLVRDERSECWRCEFYSHLRKEVESTKFKYAATAHSYARCIPYNEETKHLVGTTDEAPEFYRYWRASK